MKVNMYSGRLWKMLAILLLTLCFNSYSQTNDPGYKLVWSDEFETEGSPDTSFWNYEFGFVRNKEDQWYQPENAWVEDGLLVITAKREHKPNPQYDPNSKSWKKNREFIEYTSASMLTRGKQAWKYGRFEIRAKIDTRPGMWPAFWTLGVNGPWPACGEIDIMEYYRGKVLANAAWAGEGRETLWDSETKTIESFNDPDWSEKFHLWRMDWDQEQINLYVDDELINTISLSKTLNKRSEINNPMKQPHYIILNLAIGGTNGGYPSVTTFPSKYLVDYVRVYEKK